MARYIILGAGAVGGAIGARLALAGRGAVVVARGDHLAAILERGLRLRTPDEDLTQRLTAIAGPEEIQLDVDDILILTTKTQQANEMLVGSPSERRASACRSSLRSMEWPVRLLPIGTSVRCMGCASGCRWSTSSRAR